MAKTIYVGNLSFSTSEAEICELFAEYGTVQAVRLITDRATGRSRGFCFVEMDRDSANAAMEALDGTELGGRVLRVNEARERRSRYSRPAW